MTGEQQNHEETGNHDKEEQAASKKAKAGVSPSDLIDARITALGDWRGDTLARCRSLSKKPTPTWLRRWRSQSRRTRCEGSGVGTRRHPLHRRDVQVCREADLHRGAALKDPSRLFNASLDGNARRAIDIREGDTIDAKAFKALIRAAVALNMSKAKS